MARKPSEPARPSDSVPRRATAARRASDALRADAPARSDGPLRANARGRAAARGRAEERTRADSPARADARARGDDPPGDRSLPSDVARLRAKMDRLNARLAADVQARARLVLEIARAKAAHGLPAADPAREQAMLRRVLDEAPDGFARCDLARIFKTIFVASRGLVLADRTDSPAERSSRRRPRRC